MQKFGRAVVKLRIPILILSILLLIPAAIGYINTRTNYDILSYLPKDLETMKGQDIMLDDFGKGGFALVILEDMDEKQVQSLKKDILKVDHVCDVLWYDSLADLSLPMEILPDKIYKVFNTDDSTMLAVFFDEATSSDGSLDAVVKIRELCGKHCFVSGMSAIVEDIKDLTLKETTMYVVIAVILLSIILAVTDKRRNGDSLQSRYEHIYGRDILYYKGSCGGAAACSYYRLLYLPVAQLQGGKGKEP